MIDHKEKFVTDKYFTIEKIVPTDLCRIVTKYGLMQEQVKFSPEKEGEQVVNAHSKYSDTLMETILFFLTPHMEQLTGLELAPTYSYYRVYRPGMKLDIHKDRESCEISATVCFGYKYNGKHPDYRWGMYVEPGILCNQNPGDGIVYKGTEIQHWREEFLAGPGSYQVQGFFHFINKNGPFYPEWVFDKRPGLGFTHINDK